MEMNMVCVGCNCSNLCDKLIDCEITGLSCRELKALVQEIIENEKSVDKVVKQ